MTRADLLDVLALARRHHDHVEDDTWYCCGKCDICHQEDGDYPQGHKEMEGVGSRLRGVCGCSADTVNARLDTAIDAIHKGQLTL